MPKHRILLIEDDKTTIKSFIHLASALDDFELEVICTDSLIESLSLVRHENFDLIFVDLGLPDSQSADTIAAMSIASITTPMVVFTATDDPELRQIAEDLRFANYVLKSTFNIKVLQKLLHEHLAPNSPIAS